MESPDERATVESRQAETHRVGDEQAQRSEQLRQDVAHGRRQIQRLAQEIAETETNLVATLLGMADDAARAGRVADAERLRDKADAARRAAEHERVEASRQAPAPRAPVDDWRDAEEHRAQARREREEAARRRDEAARRRDEVAAERERLAVDRTIAAGARDAAAEDRALEEERWARQVAPGSLTVPAEAREQQRAVDEEVRATYRALTLIHQREVAADRAAEAADRAAAREDRQAAADDRQAARADRAQAENDATAAEAAREQAEIDRVTND